MQRSLILVALAAVLFVLSATAAPRPALVEKGCSAQSASEGGGMWKLNCGSGCTSGACSVEQGRDVLGTFLACRCDDSSGAKCCQAVIDIQSDSPRATGQCAACGESGQCNMEITPTYALAYCAGGGGQ